MPKRDEMMDVHEGSGWSRKADEEQMDRRNYQRARQAVKSGEAGLVGRMPEDPDYIEGGKGNGPFEFTMPRRDKK